MEKKRKSELMRGLLPPELDFAPPSTLHAKNNGTNITRLSESRAMRFRDHTWNGEKEHIKRPIQSPTLNIRKWTALKSSGLDRGEYEGGLTDCTDAVIAGYNASSSDQYKDAYLVGDFTSVTTYTNITERLYARLVFATYAAER